MSEKSRLASRHNQLMGTAYLMRGYLMRLPSEDTVTEEAAGLANEMLKLNEKLIEALKTRVDP